MPKYRLLVMAEDSAKAAKATGADKDKFKQRGDVIECHRVEPGDPESYFGAVPEGDREAPPGVIGFRIIEVEMSEQEAADLMEAETELVDIPGGIGQTEEMVKPRKKGIDLDATKAQMLPEELTEYRRKTGKGAAGTRRSVKVGDKARLAYSRQRAR